MKLRRDLPGHEARTVTDMGWAGTKNGPLLRQAATEFDIFVTVDQGIEFQQSLELSGLVRETGGCVTAPAALDWRKP
jgi:hypothetical protein